MASLPTKTSESGSGVSSRCRNAVMGGCHLTRDIRALVEDAGFTVTDAEVFYQDGVPRAYGALTLATATA